MSDLPSETERAFADYFRHTLPGGVTIRRAREGGGPVEGSLLVLRASAGNLDDLPPTDGNYSVELSCELLAPAGQPSLINGVLGPLECALKDLPAIKTFVNGDDYPVAIDNITIQGMAPAIVSGSRASRLLSAGISAVSNP